MEEITENIKIRRKFKYKDYTGIFKKLLKKYIGIKYFIHVSQNKKIGKKHNRLVYKLLNIFVIIKRSN